MPNIAALLPRLLIAISLMGAQIVLADNLSSTIEKVKPSVVGVGTFEQTRRPPLAFRGTGFAVADGLHIITNAHVLPPVLNNEKNELLGILLGQGESAKFRTAKRIAIDTEHDLALLKIEGEPLPALKFGDSSTLREGNSVAFTGFPIGAVLGLFPATHRASISSLTPIVMPAATTKQLDAKSIKRMRTPYTVFQLDGTAYPGNSGSPLYDVEYGLVYGIVNMVFVKGTKENALSEPSGITYAIPGTYIVKMLSEAGLKP